MSASGEGEGVVAFSGVGGEAMEVCGGGEGAVAASGVSEGAMQVPGGGEVAVDGIGGGERAVAVSSGWDRVVVGAGEGKERAPLDSLEYPCTMRFRLRRLLAYIRGYSHWGAYDAINGATCEIFHLSNLVKLVKAGQWSEARAYVMDFVNLYTSGKEARSLVQFLNDFKAIDSFAEGGTLAANYLRSWFLPLKKHPALSKYPCFAILVADFFFNRSDHARAFLDWQLVRNKAAAIVKEMASKTPELKGKLHLPRGRNSLYDVVNVGSSFRSRRPIKKSGRKPSTDLAQFYLQARKRLPSPQGSIPDYSAEGSEMVPVDTMMELFEKALQAGKCLVLKQADRHEYSSKEVAPLMRTRMVANTSSMFSPLRSQGHQPAHLVFKQGHHPEHSSKQGVPLMQTKMAKGTMIANSSFVFSPLGCRGHQPGHLVLKQGYQAEQSSKRALKRPALQESHRDQDHPGNESKRPRTAGNFGDDPSSSFRASHLVNEGTA